MKYTNGIISLLLTLFYGVTASAQNNMNSPYSSYGLGELGTADHAVFSALGNANISYIDSSTINFYNPAAYNALAKGSPLFSSGISVRLANFTENGTSSFSTNYNINHFALAFPVKDHFGLAFGIKPFASRNYAFSTSTFVGSDSIIYRYAGKGGVNELFLGLSSDILKFEKIRLSVGANLGFLFGELSNTRMSAMASNFSEFAGIITYAGGVNYKTHEINTFHMDLGAYFTYQINRKHRILLAATYDPSQQLKSTYSNTLFYATQIDNPASYDTVTHFNERTSITTAPSLNLGMNYTMYFPPDERTNGKLNSELSLHVNYAMADWTRFNDPADSNVLNAASKFQLGLQYSPERDVLKNAKITKFHHRMKYRVGYYTCQLPYHVLNEQVTDRGITAGLGFPIVIQNSLSAVNLGFTYGTRGVSDPAGLQENYYGINFGITIAPGNADKWFRKPKLN